MIFYYLILILYANCLSLAFEANLSDIYICKLYTVLMKVILNSGSEGYCSHEAAFRKYKGKLKGWDKVNCIHRYVHQVLSVNHQFYLVMEI